MIQKNISAAVQVVAEKLGNTVAVCRKCYIHPAVFDAYLAQNLTIEVRLKKRLSGLSPLETAVLRFLKKYHTRKS